MKKTKPELRKLIENWLWSVFSRKPALIAPRTPMCLFSRDPEPFPTLPCTHWWTGLDSECPGVKAWGSPLSLDLAKYPIQRRKMSEWNACGLAWGERRASVLVGKSQCVLQKSFFNHNIYMLPGLWQLFKLDRLFYERFSFVFTHTQKPTHMNKCQDWSAYFSL